MKRAHRRAHRVSWLILLIALPLILGGAYALRQDPSKLPPPERLEAPKPVAEGASQ